jgi:hypothetical protein
MTYDIYATRNNAFIPDVVLHKFEDVNAERFVSFEWRGADQWLKMEIQDDGHYLIIDTNYTEEFQSWLDENLENYDSLESMFGLIPKTTKQVYFVVAVEFEDNAKPSFFIDEGRADAVFGDESVWDIDNSEWQSIADNQDIFDQATKLLNEKFGV